MNTHRLLLTNLGMLCCIWALLAPTPAAAATDEELLQEAARAAQRGESAKAVAVLTDLLKQNAKAADAYYLRGREHFRLGKIAESVADLDQYVALEPRAESRQWERGISYYYAGQFQKGAKQFELYQTYHDQDVENSVWRYLCVAATEGVDKAKGNMLPITADRRVPMMEIYELYRGNLKPDDVLQAARAGNPPPEALNTRLFYAHLYLGLWKLAQGDQAGAKADLIAAEGHKIGHYMWDVAHVHADILRKAAEKPKP